MIVVQELQTWWTKLSRGAPAAVARNATRVALRIPEAARVSQLGPLVHRVRFDESDSFAPNTRDVPAGISAQRPVPCVRLIERERGVLLVNFEWEALTCGAPRRPRGEPIHLKEGQCCRVVFNGRHGSERQWWYHHTVVNIAQLARPNADIFLEIAPCTISSHLEILW